MHFERYGDLFKVAIPILLAVLISVQPGLLQHASVTFAYLLWSLSLHLMDMFVFVTVAVDVWSV